jgi:phosphonopyruvate decarboxylase
MHLGTSGDGGGTGQRDLVHVVLENHSYESTGAQRTTSGSVRWVELGRGLGYRSSTQGWEGHHRSWRAGSSKR